MSGAKLAEGAASQPATTAVSEDYAAALRAAALKTLKPRKRMATISQAEPMLSQRPLPTADAIELDYGQEEPSGASSIASSPATAPTKVAAPQLPITEPMQVDGTPTKEEGEIEEGEISDSEMAPPTPKAQREPTIPPPGKDDGIRTGENHAVTKRDPSPPMVDLPHLQPSPLSQLAPSLAPAALVDENHVRPGLALTQAQYDTAKDIILDLLGWGVPPEYLVSCGLSREIVFYVFVELNLRLPSNLDTTGLPPIPIPPASQASSSTVLSPQPTQSHPGLPLKPSTQADTTSGAVPPEPRPLSATAPPFVPGAVDLNGSSAGPSSASLHDMEQQRRQELLARKAVLASRKLKKALSSSHAASKHSSTVGRVANGTIPTKAVDDFLQSIEPATEAPPTRTTISPPSMYDMDVDDVPGLTTSIQGPITEYTPLPRPPPPTSLSISASTATAPRSPILPQSAVSSASDRSYDNAPSTSTASFSTTPLSYDGDVEMDAVPGLYHPSPDDPNSLKPRRGTKRPVASDFVDMDPGPSRSGGKTHTDFFRANIRRKTTGFAGLTQRRCIIDLSDSEAEEDNSMKQDIAPSRTDSRGPKATTPQPSAAPTPRHHSPRVVVPSITPAILEEKEAEIRRMRELIAQREQNRKKKLIASSRSTPATAATPTNGVPIKQEDDDSARLRSFEPSRSGSSATPDPVTNGRPHDSQDERSVLAALLPHDTGENGTISLPDSEPTSSAATPTDVTARTLEHPTTGDQVITDEARHEQVVVDIQDQSESSHDEVDVIGQYPETSTQAVSESQHDTSEQATPEAAVFSSYHSLLDYHPLLRDHSRQDSATEPPAHSASSGAPPTSTQPIVDLEPLKEEAVMKYLSSGTGRICHYEVPGGGECRDKNCEDVHLSRVSSVEPSDEDTAQYLCSSLPAGPRYGVKAFRDALDVARLRHPTMTFDARVQEALSALGLR